MSAHRSHFSWSFAVLLSLSATLALAKPTSSSPTMLQSGEQSSTEDAHTSAICHASFCEIDQDCACSGATSAACVSNECKYTYSGGGGGGGGGPVCHQQFCSEDWDCYCGTNQGYCGSDFICYF